MRIISKFHDYYDSAMAYGQDKSVVYVRNSEELDEKDPLVDRLWAMNPSGGHCGGERHNRHGTVDMIPFTVAFCGRLYRGIRVHHTPNYNIHEYKTPETHYFYDLGNLEGYLRQFDIGFSEERQRNWRENVYYTQRGNLEKFLAHKEGTTELEEALLQTRIVIMLCMSAHSYSYHAKKRWIRDPSLRRIEFFKVVDPFTAYQELDMYVGGKLPQLGNMTATIEDKYRIAQHGFDKWSFRKMPENK